MGQKTLDVSAKVKHIEAVENAIAVDIPSGVEWIGHACSAGRITIHRGRSEALEVGNHVNHIDTIEGAVAINIAGDVIARLCMNKCDRERCTKDQKEDKSHLHDSPYLDKSVFNSPKGRRCPTM